MDELQRVDWIIQRILTFDIAAERFLIREFLEILYRIIPSFEACLLSGSFHATAPWLKPDSHTIEQFYIRLRNIALMFAPNE